MRLTFLHFRQMQVPNTVARESHTISRQTRFVVSSLSNYCFRPSVSIALSSFDFMARYSTPYDFHRSTWSYEFNHVTFGPVAEQEKRFRRVNFEVNINYRGHLPKIYNYYLDFKELYK